LYLCSAIKKQIIMKKSFTKIIHVVAACLLLSQSVVSCQKDEKNDRHALVGLFSISPTQQVRFAPGNLQYQASTNTWRFAEHQWDVIGSANSDISSTYSGWIDLFGWGTSGWNSGANCYQPWSVSVDDSDYFPGGSPNNDLTGAYAEADWAWHNPISNGGDSVHQWRILTRDEWRYLLNYRADATSKIGLGNINGVGGFIILPDNWTLPSGCSFTSGLTRVDEAYYPDGSLNSYTLAQWAEMEAAGAVFLPAAGSRWGLRDQNGNFTHPPLPGTAVYYVGIQGVYWTSKQFSDVDVFSMCFSNSEVCVYPHCCRSVGASVRPVLVNN
jgi:hypothetical protein